ncbi:hypothetical protein [Desulfonatronospira sp.]|uniref:hypothetical protein n=1 Tax=Desulfonatronospira sp. TaxID=1962951 RepID=UPI0025BA2AFB|nr:hypothetical protein [Desulfonatronospira sp.]
MIIYALVLFLLAGCAGKRVIPDDPPRPDLQHRAAQAWDRGEHIHAQDMYTRLLDKFELEKEKEVQAWKRLAISAGKNRDYRTCLQSLQNWARLDPAAENTWQWHHYHSLAIRNLESEQHYVRYLDRLIWDEDVFFDIRLNAARKLTEHHLDSRRYQEAAQTLTNIYGLAFTDEQRAGLEKFGARLFLNMELQELRDAASFLDHEKKLFFPYNLFWWAYHNQRLQEDTDRWQSIRPVLQEIARESQLVDRRALTEDLDRWEKKLGKPSPEIALLLPLSHQYSNVGWKVMRGAGLAHWDLLTSGTEVRVNTINTNNPGWLDELKQMDNVSLAGGPLSRQDWDSIREAGLHEEMVFLTFLPSMEKEGSQGWRFFPSARDQVRSLLQFSTKGMNIRNYAVLYPEEDFGRAYAETFWEEARGKDVQVKGMMSYPTDDHAGWNRIVSSLLGTSASTSRYLSPDPGFDAVFIPDTLGRAQGLVPRFFYFNAEHLVFLGPMLWYQGYEPETLEQQFFTLALSTGAWDSHSRLEPAMELITGLRDTLQGEADFWVALGYDFVRFASRLGDMPLPGDNEKVNRILSHNRFNSWSMAPISWDSYGKASQDLFVFQMDSHQLQPADPESLQWMIESRKQRRAMWLERIRGQQRQEQEP